MPRSRLLEDIRENGRNRPGRIALVLAALSVGILSLTVLACILKGLEQRGEQLIQELGANVISVSLQGEGTPGFQAEDLQALRRGLTSEATVSGLQHERSTLSETAQNITLAATDENFLSIKQWPMQAGRWMDTQNLQQGAAVCVLSATLAHQLELQLGQNITVKDTPLTLIGFLPEGLSAENTLYIPSSLQPFWNSETAEPDSQIQQILIQAHQVTWATIQSRAENILYSRSTLRERLHWTTPETLTNDIKKLQTSLKWTAGSVAVLCLLLGGATLMSLMTANVRERIPEIGLRLSLGAGPSDIYTLFLVEALLITVLAALIGSIGGHLLVSLGPLPLELPYVMNLQTAVIPSTLCIILALLFSWGPASMAARINPADALRHE